MALNPIAQGFVFFPLCKALSAPLLLKAKETSDLSGHTCAVLHQCLEQLSKQEEVGKELPYLNECACHNKALLMLMYTLYMWYLLHAVLGRGIPNLYFLQGSNFFS